MLIGYGIIVYRPDLAELLHDQIPVPALTPAITAIF
jgi:hypothetical protein